jgi:hypothetical protein
MTTFIAGIAIGALVSWAIAHVYYRRASKDQASLYKKLSSDLRGWILADTRKHLSVADLDALLQEKTIDPSSSGTLGFKACPKCGSENLSRESDLEVDTDVGDYGEPVHSPIYIPAIACLDCGWRRSACDSG